MLYEGFNLFNGGGPLPPRWGLGFTQRVRSLFTADEVKAEADSFKLKVIRLILLDWSPDGKASLIPELLNGIQNVIQNRKSL
jgi:alpha-D-xyloside xylohydrolase